MAQSLPLLNLPTAVLTEAGVPIGAASALPCILDLDLPGLQAALAELGQPGYRARQVYKALHHRLVGSWDAMTDLPARLRETLAERYRITSGELVVQALSQDGTRKSEDVKRAPIMAADSGFHSFVQANLDDLVAGKTITLAFGVVSQRSSFKFRVRKADKPAAGENRVALVAEPDSLLRLLADPLYLVYDTQTRDLLEYNGLSNLVDTQTRKPTPLPPTTIERFQQWMLRGEGAAG